MLENVLRGTIILYGPVMISLLIWAAWGTNSGTIIYLTACPAFFIAWLFLLSFIR